MKTRRFCLLAAITLFIAFTSCTKDDDAIDDGKTEQGDDGITPQGQYVHIPDANFKACLVGHNNPLINTNEDDEISIAEAQAFTGTINCIGRNISDLTGIEAFVNLRGLLCGGPNQLTSLDLSKNTALERLECWHNQLSSLDLSKNTALERLECYANPLKSLDLSKNTALKDLRCYENQLSSLDLSKNTALEMLNCSANELSSLDLSKNTALKTLRCSDNPLISLNLKNGNNKNMAISVPRNSNLSCIQVDDVAYSNANWSLVKHFLTYYSENCP